MVIAFANNQTLVAKDGTPVTIFTDPVSLEGFDRGTANFLIHSIWANGAVVTTLTYTAQVSNDGTNWVDSSTLTDFDTGVTTSPKQKVAEVHGAFIRFKFNFSITTGSSTEVGAVTFDLHVLLDHA